MTWLRHRKAIDSIDKARAELTNAEDQLADPANPTPKRVRADLDEARRRVAALTAVADLYESGGKRGKAT